MSFSLIHRYTFREFADVSPAFLKKLGVGFLMLDLDNTIALYANHKPTDSVRQWVEEIKGSGMELFFISNTKRENRIERFADELKIGFIKNAGKPSPAGILRALEIKGYRPEESAFLGDQIFTDTLAANRAGVISIIVKPLSMKNPLFAIRFAVESPFRAACTLKMQEGDKA